MGVKKKSPQTTKSHSQASSLDSQGQEGDFYDCTLTDGCGFHPLVDARSYQVSNTLSKRKEICAKYNCQIMPIIQSRKLFPIVQCKFCVVLEENA